MAYYPVYMDLRARRWVVLGGGSTASEKVRGLLEAEAAVTVVALEASSELQQLEAEGRLVLHQREYLAGDLVGARLAIDATWELAAADIASFSGGNR